MKVSIKIGGVILIFNLILIFIYLSNFSYSPSPSFLVYDTNTTNPSTYTSDSQINIEENSPNTCKIYFPALSPLEIKQYFPYTEYKPCEFPVSDSILITESNFQVNCSDNPQPLFYFEDYPQRLGGRRAGINWTKDPKWYKSSEFLLIKCSESRVHTLVFSRYKQGVSMKANAIKNKLGPNKKPFNVLLMVLDVVSRFSAYQNLPKTVEYLKSGFKDSDISAYEFTKSAVPEIKTVYNMARIIFGVTYESIIQEYGAKGVLSDEKPKKGTVHNAIWNYYSKLGYTTMFLHDSVSDYLASIVGRNINADHVFVNFWKIAWSVYGWTDFSNTQRCAGSQNSHSISFNYTYQYFDTYPENNKFAYVHLDAAHESSGNIRTVDEDLLGFIKGFAELMKEKNENFAFFLIGDHGRKPSSLKFDVLGYFESRSPFTSLFLSREVEDEWGIKEILHNNVDKLISRFDINLSLKHIASYPYKNREVFDYSAEKRKYSVGNTISVFKELISEKRNCEDLGVLFEFCPCRWFEPLIDVEINDSVLFSNIIEVISKHFLVNATNVFTCRPMAEYSDVFVEKFQIDPLYRGLSTVFQVKLKANFVSEVEVKLDYVVLNEKFRDDIKFGKVDSAFNVFFHNSREIFLRVDSVKITSDLCRQQCLC